MLDEFLNRKNGPDLLAASLQNVKLKRDVARVALRYMFSVGHSEAVLSDLLSKAADVPANPPLPTEPEVQSITAEVVAKGDPARGEEIFRRADISCMRCHSVCKAGGDVGPELSAVGSTSPPDYIVRSILNPSVQIKEEFLTRVILTNSGVQYVGIVKDRKNGQVQLRDAAGKTIIIAADDIDTETEGRSLMPEGLTKFLTHQEFLDLASFVSSLGRPGPYAVRTKPIIQRWRVLRNITSEIADETPNVELLRIHVLDAKPEDWAPVYAMVSGVLPLADAASLVTGAKTGPTAAAFKAIYLQGEFDVTEPGSVIISNHVARRVNRLAQCRSLRRRRREKNRTRSARRPPQNHAARADCRRRQGRQQWRRSGADEADELSGPIPAPWRTISWPDRRAIRGHDCREFRQAFAQT